LLGAATALGVACRIDNVKPDVVFDHLTHQAGERTAGGDDQMQHTGATLFLFDCSLDRLDLAADPFDPVQELELLALGMRQGLTSPVDRVGGMVCGRARIVEGCCCSKPETQRSWAVPSAAPLLSLRQGRRQT